MELTRLKRATIGVLAVAMAIAALCVSASGATPPKGQKLVRGLRRYPIASGHRPEGLAFGPGGDLWFAESYEGQMGTVSPSGEITEFPLPVSATQVATLKSDSKHRLWFTEPRVNRIGMIDQGGEVSEFPLPADDGEPAWERHVIGLAAAPDFMWFSVSRGSHPYPPYSTERSPARVGKITPDGRITEFTLPDATAEPAGMASDRAGNLWLTENVGAETGKEGIRIRRVTPAGGLTEKTLSDEGGWPGAIALGPEGNIWISESDGLVCKVLRVTPRWQIRRFTLPPRGAESRVTSRIESMTAGPDGNLWFVASDPSVLGRITPRGQIAETRVGENASSPESLVRGPGGSLWFNEWRAASITRFAPWPAAPRREH